MPTYRATVRLLTGAAVLATAAVTTCTFGARADKIEPLLRDARPEVRETAIETIDDLRED